MKLVSFQSMDAFKQLVNKGYLETDERFVDVKKMGFVHLSIKENRLMDLM